MYPEDWGLETPTTPAAIIAAIGTDEARAQVALMVEGGRQNGPLEAVTTYAQSIIDAATDAAADPAPPAPDPDPDPEPEDPEPDEPTAPADGRPSVTRERRGLKSVWRAP